MLSDSWFWFYRLLKKTFITEKEVEMWIFGILAFITQNFFMLTADKMVF